MNYSPKQGDIIMIDFNPQLGHEQKGRRPAIVLWNDKLLKWTNSLCLVCAVSHTDNGFPLHIELQTIYKKIDGFAFCEQLRVMDINERNPVLIDKVEENTLNKILSVIKATL